MYHMSIKWNDGDDDDDDDDNDDDDNSDDHVYLVLQRCVPTRVRSTAQATSGRMAATRTALAGMVTWDTISVTTCE